METHIPDYLALRAHLESVLLALFNHETNLPKNAKGWATIGFPEDKIIRRKIGDRHFYIAFMNAFQQITFDSLPRLCIKKPEHFGTGNAEDVLKGLYVDWPEGDFEFFKDFLRLDQFAIVVEWDGQHFREISLRLDLYRLIEIDKESGKPEFTGGLLHLFRHFSYNGHPLSSSPANYDIEISEMIDQIILCFFASSLVADDRGGLVGRLIVNDSRELKMVFYKEENSLVHFIRTAHPD